MTDIVLVAAKIAPVYPTKAEIISGIAGVTITAGQAVYFIAASGLLGLADANVSGSQQFRGIALNGGGAGQAISVLKEGHCYGFTLSGQSYDDPLFLSDTEGVLGDSAGTLEVTAGLVVALPDRDATKVAYISARYGADYA